MSEKKTNEERQKEVDRQLELMKAAIGDDNFSDDDSDTSDSEQLKERNSKKDAMESARKFLWDEADDDEGVLLGGPFPKSASSTHSRSTGLSTSLFGTPKDHDDGGMNQSINLMDASEARVHPNSRSSDHSRSSLTNLFARASQSAATSWNDAVPSRDSEEFIGEKRRGFRSASRKIGLCTLWLLAVLALAVFAYYVLDFAASTLDSSGGSIEDKLVETGLLDPALLDDPNSPQSMALEWITIEDPAKLSADDEFVSQRYALAVLFFATSGSTWTNSRYWLTGSGYCLWYGVECVGEEEYLQLDGNAQVFQLNLTKNELQGPLPTELQAFEELFLLDLPDNGLTGTLPVWSFSTLRGMSLSNNQLAGTIPAQLVKEANPELRSLDLSHNSLYGGIPLAIGGATNLRELRLDHNDLTGSIPASIYALTRLEALHLAFNQLQGSLPDSFYQLQRLETLHLHENAFTGAISSQLAKLSHLELLTLNNNQLEGTVPDIFSNIQLLEELHLHNNGLTGTIPNTVCELRKDKLTYVSVDCVDSLGTGVACGCCTQCL